MRRSRTPPLPLLAVLACLATTACAAAPASRSEGTGSTSAVATAAVPSFLGGSALVIHSAGLDALLADPRDAGLRQALALVDERLAELPRELPGFAVPPGALGLAFDLVSAPFTLRADLQGGNGAAPLAPDVQWTVRTRDAEQAHALVARVGALLAALRIPSTPALDHPGFTAITTRVGPLFYGAVD